MLDLAARLRAKFPTPELIQLFVAKRLPVEVALLPAVASISAEEYSIAAATLLVNCGETLLEDDAETVSAQRTVVARGNTSGIERLSTYGEFFSACCKELEKSRSVRLTIVGPTFLEPEWWHEREANASPAPDFSLDLRRRILAGTLDQVEIILRNNTVRYVAGLAEYVDGEDEWKKLIDEMIVNSFLLFGNRGERGPRIRCFDPGYAHLPHIFDRCALIGTRRTASERVSGGWLINDPDVLRFERERWATLFDNGQTQEAAIVELRQFLEKIRDAFCAATN